MQKIRAIVFIKKLSERIPNKNFRLFNGFPLYTIILERLNNHPWIDKLLIDSDSQEILEFANQLSKGIAINRPPHLIGGHISGNDLVKYDIQFCENEHIFQTHVTNPLLTNETITNAIEKYVSSLPVYDSLFSVTRIQQRVFQSDGTPVNHEKGSLNRTQDLNPVFQENSSYFIFSKTSFVNSGYNRLGLSSQMHEISSIEAMDIDYEKDFVLAEIIDNNKNKFPEVFNL